MEVSPGEDIRKGTADPIVRDKGSSLTPPSSPEMEEFFGIPRERRLN